MAPERGKGMSQGVVGGQQQKGNRGGKGCYKRLKVIFSGLSFC